MNRFLPVFARLLAFGLLVSVSASAEPAALSSVSGDLAAALKAAVPAEGLVIYTQDNEIYLDLTREKGTAVGRRYAVERLGAEIRHPVSGQSVGFARNRVGEVEITWLQEGFCKARLVGTAAEGGIRVKDLVRLSTPPGVMRFPLRHEDGTLSRLTELVDGELAAVCGALEGTTPKVGPALAVAAGAAGTVTSLAAEADVAVAGRVTATAIELNVIRMSTGAVEKSFTVPIPESLRALAADKIRATPSFAAAGSLERVSYREGAEVTVPLDFIPVDMTCADVDGDGTDEVIFAEEKHLRICRVKMGGTIEELARLSVGWSAKIMHVFAGDIDGDGKAEIYVTEKPGNYIRSSAYRYANGRLDRFWKESDVFLRVLRSERGFGLCGQRYGSARPFERGLTRYTLSGNNLTAAAAGLPGSFTVFDFAAIGSTGFLASINYENKLQLYNAQGSTVWTSAEVYGGSDVRVESADKRNSAEERIGVSAVDIDGDGVEEILAVQNMLEGGTGPGFIRLGNLQQYKNGRLVALALENGTLVERWKTKSYSGIIKGFTLARPLARGWEAVFFNLEYVSFREKRATLRILPLS